MNFSLSGLLAGYHKEKLQHPELVLATIVDSHGSSYRKPGARMLITPTSTCHGLLGGDYVHRVVLADAKIVFMDRGSHLLELGPVVMEGIDLSQELETNAGLSIFMEYIDSSRQNTLDLLLKGVQSGTDYVLATICETGLDACPVGANALVLDKHIESPDLSPEYTGALHDIARSVQENDQPALESCMFGSGNITAFFDVIKRPVTFLIIGAGPDAVPLLRLGHELGWNITVVDSRPEYTAASVLSTADRIITCEPAQLSAELEQLTFDAVVLMTHRLDLDTQFLAILKGNKRIKYIGLLGTARRREILLEAVSIQPGVSGEMIYAPVGLDIGGKSPEQVALSVICEIQAVLNGRRGGHLTAPEHLPGPETPVSVKDLYAVVLAAGGSRRFGGIKQLLEFNSKSLLRRVIDVATATLASRVKLVLGIKPNKLQRETEGYDLEVVVNRDWENGVASSVRAGIKSLPETCRAVLLVLCDQPLIEVQHLQMLVDEWLKVPGKIIASAYNDTLGVPAIFPRTYFENMLQLKGDRGAKSIIESNIENVISIQIPEAGMDINTQEDVIKLLQR